MTRPPSRSQDEPEALERLDLSPHAASATLARWFIRQLATEHSLHGELLTPPPPAYVRSLRRWFVEQLADQLPEGGAPVPPGEECLIS
jgi:hypothetical protein